MPKMNIFLLLDHLEKLATTNFRFVGKVWIDKEELRRTDQENPYFFARRDQRG